ncbi:hypothetical protein RM780_09735 [Streptomyces sp. DSM 44917]|uniref:Uncharacterized protein n=1 Tax=Streptomyces boetiae TaxID=3075541 RepID=A0ABU2L7G4_9ACTN|nr:hypothetical protein [Streptomyces sp. DSM 44917]MDT0307243.1 hypothetical protein [Streptomyces sp. DSM 44917]
MRQVCPPGSLACLDIAASAYEEIRGGPRSAPGKVIEGGDALRARIAAELASGAYAYAAQNGPVILLRTRTNAARADVEFAALSYGYSFEDHAHQLVRAVVTALRESGLQPQLQRGVQPVGDGFLVRPGASPDTVHVVVHEGTEADFYRSAAVLHTAGYRVAGEHEGTGVLDVTEVH